jgi:hypothetical protein
VPRVLGPSSCGLERLSGRDKGARRTNIVYWKASGRRGKEQAVEI